MGIYARVICIKDTVEERAKTLVYEFMRNKFAYLNYKLKVRDFVRGVEFIQKNISDRKANQRVRYEIVTRAMAKIKGKLKMQLLKKGSKKYEK